MREAIKKEVFEYSDEDTFFTTTDKGFAVKMYEYAKKKSGQNLDVKINNLKEAIEEAQND